MKLVPKQQDGIRLVPRVQSQQPKGPWWQQFVTEEVPDIAEGLGRATGDWAAQTPYIGDGIPDKFTTSDPNWRPGVGGNVGEFIGTEGPAALASATPFGRSGALARGIKDGVIGAAIPAEGAGDRLFNAVAGVVGEPVAKGVGALASSAKNFGEWAGRKVGIGDSVGSVQSGIDSIIDRTKLAGVEDPGQARIGIEQRMQQIGRNRRGVALEAEKNFRKDVVNPAYASTAGLPRAQEEFNLNPEFWGKFHVIRDNYKNDLGATGNKINTIMARHGFMDGDAVADQTPITYAAAEDMRQGLNGLVSAPGGEQAKDVIAILDEALESGANMRVRPDADSTDTLVPVDSEPTGMGTPDPVGPNPYKEPAPGFGQSAREYAEDFVHMSRNPLFEHIANEKNTDGVVNKLLTMQPGQAQEFIQFMKANHPAANQMLKNATTLHMAELLGDTSGNYAGKTVARTKALVNMFDKPEKIRILKDLLEPETFAFMTKDFIPKLRALEGQAGAQDMLNAVTPYARVGDGVSPLRFVIALKGGKNPGWGDTVALKGPPSDIIKELDRVWSGFGAPSVSAGVRETYRENK